MNGEQYSEQLGILPGQRVQAGDLLVQLDRASFELAVAVAQAKLEKAEADFAQLRAWERPEVVEQLAASVRQSEARHKLAVADYQRFGSLAASAAVSQSELERAATELATDPPDISVAGPIRE